MNMLQTSQKSSVQNYIPTILQVRYFTIGLTLILLYGFLVSSDIESRWILNLQSNEFYKQTTGYLLFTLLIYQYWLALSRRNASSGVKKLRLRLHKWLGALLMLALIVHSLNFGYAYQVVLNIVFMVNSLVGMCNIETMKFKKALYVSWVVVHVALANLTIAMVFYHIYIIYRFS